MEISAYRIGILLGTVKNFDVKINPTSDMKRNVEKVIRFIELGSSLK